VERTSVDLFLEPARELSLGEVPFIGESKLKVGEFYNEVPAKLF